MVKLPHEELRTMTVGEKAAWMKARAFVHSDDLPDDWWARLFEIETAPETSEAEELGALGVEVAGPDDLGNAEVSEMLWEIIETLARERRVFLTSTDHLDDRELLRRLHDVILPARKRAIPVRREAGWHVDLLSNGSPGDFDLWLRQYATESQREAWSERGTVLPAREHSPYKRDRNLPQLDLPIDRPIIMSMPVDANDREAGVYLSVAPLAKHPS